MLNARLQEETRHFVNEALVAHYRCPEDFAPWTPAACEASRENGYFQFGPDAICYGRSALGFLADQPTDHLYDVLQDVVPALDALRLPFDPSEIVANLRGERYAASEGSKTSSWNSTLREVYYLLRPFLSETARRCIQRRYFRRSTDIAFPRWPVDTTVEHIFERQVGLWLKSGAGARMPFVWFWPDGAPSCAMVTHDVETLAGRDHCDRLIGLNEEFRIKASFQIVPEERYSVSPEFLQGIRDRGFEVGVHDLNHDGRLFSSKEMFLRRVRRINEYGRQFQASGFRSAVLYRNVEWLRYLDFAYDMSVPSVGHLEAQRGGCCTVMPFFVGQVLELPVTTTQDYSLFHMLNQYSIDLWKVQLDVIQQKHGLASFIVHPDYVKAPRAREVYRRLLAHLAELSSRRKTWMALPRDVNKWWRERSQMTLARSGNDWTIQGQGSERARLAYATVEGNQVVYRLNAGLGAMGLADVLSLTSENLWLTAAVQNPIAFLFVLVLLAIVFARGHQSGLPKTLPENKGSRVSPCSPSMSSDRGWNASLLGCSLSKVVGNSLDDLIELNRRLVADQGTHA
jgi:hypothetical protein